MPPSTDTIRSLLVPGSYGPKVAVGGADMIPVPDGVGFGGIEGRKQDAGDKYQNNYSVTDANFYPTLGLLRDRDSGRPMNYVQQIQAYNAAGYVATFHPDLYARMVRIQDAGGGSVLGMSLNVLGVDDAPTDPGMSAAGLTVGALSNERVPGGSPMLAKSAVMSGTDLAGEEWARPHHAESSWGVYKKLIDAGLDWQTAGVLSGDDAVSGAGRINGFNNQDGKTGLNADERAVFQVGARVQQRTGISVVSIMAGGHSHTGIDRSAMTSPRIDAAIGTSHTTAPEQRYQALYHALVDGTISGGDVSKFGLGEGHRRSGVDGPSTTLAGAVADTRESQPNGMQQFADGVDNFWIGVHDAVSRFTSAASAGLANHHH